jgi:integrase
MSLTAKRIEKLKNQPGRHFDSDGLYLKIQPLNAKQPRANRGCWILRYEMGGRERYCGLGRLADFKLDEARELARKARQLIKDGVDPISQKEADKAQRALEEAKAITFEFATQQYLKQHLDKWKNAKTARNFESTMAAYVFPVIGRLSVAAIDTGLVLKVLEPIWKEMTVTADRLRGRIEAVLDWSTVRGYRTGDNPARWRGHLSEVLPARNRIAKTKHLPALPYNDMAGFWKELSGREGTAARAFQFLLLTAARTGEVIGATKDEIDFHNKVWTVPASRMKSGTEHKVPLSDRAMEILKSLPVENSPYLFVGPNGGSLSPVAILKVLKGMGRNDISVHGFRSSFRDWAAERTSYPNHVVEMALAHSIGNAVEKAYRRGDLLEKRRKLLADWERFCLTPAATGATVVALRA